MGITDECHPLIDYLKIHVCHKQLKNMVTHLCAKCMIELNYLCCLVTYDIHIHKLIHKLNCYYSDNQKVKFSLKFYT